MTPRSVLPAAATLIGALFVAGKGMTASADEATVHSSRAEVEKVMRAAEKLFAAGANASAKDLASLLYTPDVVIVGEGDAQAKRGMANAVTDVQAWYDWLGPDGQRTCTYTMTTPVIASGTMLAAFTLLHCGANPPAHPKEVEVRVLHVWNKGPQGWRVELEMWAPGKL